MECKECGKDLEVERRCRQVRLRCSGCAKEYHIHELASELDPRIEAELERFSCIVYD